MEIILHPLQSLATILRSWSTGLTPKQLSAYDKDFLEMIKEGDVQLYRSADEAMDDILGRNVRNRHYSKVQKADSKTL